MFRLILMLAISLSVALIVLKIFRSFGTIFRIDIKHERPTLSGTIPGRAWSEVRPFLVELPLPKRCHIIGVRDETRFQLVFSENVNEGLRQRIRNFLYLNL